MKKADGSRERRMFANVESSTDLHKASMDVIRRAHAYYPQQTYPRAATSTPLAKAAKRFSAALGNFRSPSTT